MMTKYYQRDNYLSSPNKSFQRKYLGYFLLSRTWFCMPHVYNQAEMMCLITLLVEMDQVYSIFTHVT